MNTGMQDAFNLSWKLALVVHGIAKPDLLASYSRERSAVGDVVLRNATRLTDIAVMRNPVAQRVRNFAARIVLGLSQVQHRFAEQLSEVDIAYPESPLSVTAEHAPHGGELPKAGQRWHAPTDGAPPIGAAEKPRFAVIGDPAITAKLTARFAGLVEQRGLPAGVEGLWIVRPDGYVGLVAREDDAAAAESYLGEIAS